MTREEEIKGLLVQFGASYGPATEGNVDAGLDLEYLLDRNEELQRRVDALTDAAKRCSYHVAARMHDLGDTELEDDYGPYKEVKADYMALLTALDAKEQDDD